MQRSARVGARRTQLSPNGAILSNGFDRMLLLINVLF
jgi:hypothetical protein